MVVGVVSVVHFLHNFIANIFSSLASNSKRLLIHTLMTASLAVLVSCSSTPVSQETINEPVKNNTVKTEVAPKKVSIPVKGIQSDAVSSDNNVIVNIDTELGPLQVKFFPDKAPAVVKQLLSLIESGYFDSDVFLESRPQLGFVITKLGSNVKVFEIKDESNELTSARGSIAITKAAASRSYLNNIFFGYNPQPQLEQHYTIFGQVITGLDAIEKQARSARYKVNSFKIVK